MFTQHTPWDDGAATAVTVAVAAVGQSTIINGPLVWFGYSLKNSAGGTAQIEFFDGESQELWQTSIAAGGNQQGILFDKGVIVKSDLEINVGGNAPVNGVVYVRTEQAYTERVRHWHTKSEHSKSPSPQAPSQAHPSQQMSHSRPGG